MRQFSEVTKDLSLKLKKAIKKEAEDLFTRLKSPLATNFLDITALKVTLP